MITSVSLRVTKLVWIINVCTILLSITSLKCSEQVCLGLSSVSMVCPGDNLTLFCCTNGSTLRWIFNVSLTPLHLDPGRAVRVVNQESPETEQPFTINNQTVLHLSKIANSPLMSVLTVDNVITDWNQTKIECTRSMEGTSITTIHIIDHTATIPMAISDEQFGEQNVTITLVSEWFQNEVVFNSVHVHPPASVRSVGNSSVQLTIPYNTEHNISVAICGQPLPEAIKLYYISCDEPTNDDLNVTVINYTAPALEGSVIAIDCDTLITNSYTSTCVEGIWKPNLKQISMRCKTGLDILDTDHAESDRSLILGASLSAFFLTLALGILFTVLIVSIKKCSVCVHKCNPSLSLQSNQQERLSNDNLRNHYLGEYSEITLQSQNNDMDETQPRTVVYADLGPLSYGKKKPFTSVATILDDDRIEYAQLNTRISAKSQKDVQQTSTCPESSSGNPLNLDSLLIQLQPEVNEKWYQFGEALGIEKSILDKYLSYLPDQNIIEVCDYWLRNHTGQPSWNEVAAALKQIGFQQLGYGIERVYETGRLPKEVNMNAAVNMESDMFLDETEQPPPIPPRLT